MTARTNEHIGIDCQNIDALQERLLVSDLQILDPDNAAQLGYGNREVIVPLQPRAANCTEMTDFIANDRTEVRLRLVALPEAIGHTAIDLWDNNRETRDQYPDNLRFHNMGQGFMGTGFGHRIDAPDLLNVSMDLDKHMVGDHIDTYKTADRRIAVLNMGPGSRWHRITDLSRTYDLAGQRPGSRLRVESLRQKQAAGEAPFAYWLRLNEPTIDPDGNVFVEALLNAPVGEYLHDGATWNCADDSQAVFIALPPDGVPDRYPSLL